MYAVRNSSRALLAALVPLAAVHAILLAMALLATQTEPPEMSLPVPDKILIYYAGHLALDGILLFAGHLVLRRSAVLSRLAYALMGGAMAATSYVLVLRNGLVLDGIMLFAGYLVLRQSAISGRLAYALMGGAMAAATYLLALRNGLLLIPPKSGSEITLGLLPMGACALAGFLYGHFAGLESITAEPGSSAGAESASAPRTFAGPVRVRTSVGAVMIAGLVPASLTAVLSFMVLTLFLPGLGPVFAAAFPAQTFLMIMIATILPSAIFILAVHHIARAFRRDRGVEYAGIGGVAGGLCAGLIAPLMPINSIFLLLAPGGRLWSCDGRPLPTLRGDRSGAPA
jgi:hypothetical protein